ncbi:hypothetical protein GRZ40_002654 [Salmonella bongori]|uniref:Uncharacterized protein n=1 Tax=Salmonella bongori TaxID=54736 RepID=A0A698WAY8_SALBN|nr:hypothetical protein [Salmonella bongori]EGE4655798.1 hypothetical protein [Salmonella bongori serovar 40:z35:- str. 95-0123]EGE4659144.1 hypothetical protein [Salmonella bongori serovar 48:i:- str. 94-0708]EDP8607393.1 hypothetical protein [Salmonella bongori]EDP8650184.1 hypothetical protein [Salmonella bongori]
MRLFTATMDTVNALTSGMINARHKKTTRRWFHDTAYCFDYSCLSHGTRSGT